MKIGHADLQIIQIIPYSKSVTSAYRVNLGIITSFKLAKHMGSYRVHMQVATQFVGEEYFRNYHRFRNKLPIGRWVFCAPQRLIAKKSLLHVGLAIHPPIHLVSHLSLDHLPPVSPSSRPFIYVFSVYLCFYLSIYLSVYLPIYPSRYLLIYLSFLSIYFSMYLSV